jgi:hypothetical protein
MLTIILTAVTLYCKAFGIEQDYNLWYAYGLALLLDFIGLAMVSASVD